MDEKDVTFADEAQEDGTDAHRRRIPDEELDEVFTDRRVSDIAGYDGDEEPDAEPDTAEGFTFEDIDLAVRTAKKADATGDERRHAGMVFCGGDTQETGRADGLLSGFDTCPTCRINGKCRTEKAACHAGEI